MSLNNLGFLLQDQGDLVGARPLLERGVAIFEKALGPEHLDTVMVRKNLFRLERASQSWWQKLKAKLLS
jgi:Tetratricopeptide repeat